MRADTILLSTRLSAGWSQRELARRCGVAQPSISDIESGDRDTTVSKLGQIIAAADFAVVAVPTARPSVADWAARLASVLADDPGAVEKTLVQIAADLAAVEPATRVALCVTPPPTTSDRAIDAVLAALVEHLLSKDRLPVPSWVNDPTLVADEPWDLVDVPGLRDAARAATPKAFSRRNVFVPADFLESA